MANIVSTQLHIESQNHNGITGHVEIKAYVVDTDEEGNEINGVPEIRGIDPVALETRFGPAPDNLNKWLQWTKEDMVRRHQVRNKVRIDLHELAGKRI